MRSKPEATEETQLLSANDDDRSAFGKPAKLQALNDATRNHNQNNSKAAAANDDDDGQQHSSNLTTITLAFAILTQSYLLVSVFPYSGFLAMHLIPNLTEETAGSYAGLIASSFMFGRTFTSFEWGKAADKYGRTFVIKNTLLLSAIFSILFGLAPSFPLALLIRFCLGLCNGMIGSIQTIVRELAHGDQAKETRMMAIVFGTWGYGFLINPAISGYLSDPVGQYPNSKLLHYLALEPLLREYPYLLPNILASLFCLIAYWLVCFNVEETLPEDQRQDFAWYDILPSCCKNAIFTTQTSIYRSVSSDGFFKHLHLTNAEVTSDKDVYVEGGTTSTQAADGRHNSRSLLPRWIRPSPSTTGLVILSPRSAIENKPPHNNDDQNNHENGAYEELYAKDNDKEGNNVDNQQEKATIRSLWNRKSTRQHLLVYWFYSFLVISVDEVFPLFAISKNSGLAIHEQMIGNILSETGLCYVVIQYFLLTQLVDRFGFYPSLRIGALFSIPLVYLIPVCLVTNRAAPEGSLTLSTMVFLSVVNAICRAFASITFSTVTMTLNRTVPAHQRATMNGLSMLGGSLAKGLGPAFSGILFSTSVQRITAPFGSVVVYSIIATLGLGLFIGSMLLKPPEEHNHCVKHEHSGTRNGTNGHKRDAEEEPPSF